MSTVITRTYINDGVEHCTTGIPWVIKFDGDKSTVLPSKDDTPGGALALGGDMNTIRERWLCYLVVKPDKKIFMHMFRGRDRVDLNAMIRAGLNIDECTLPDEDIEITDENRDMTFAEICRNYHGPHTPQRSLRFVEREDGRLVITAKSKRQLAAANRERERLLANRERERLKKQKAHERAQRKQAAKAKRAEYEAEVAMIQQMAEVEAVKQMSEAEEQARTQKLLAMPENDKCERKKCRVMRGVHQDILKRNGCDRCIGGKPCKRCKKIFQTDISSEEKAKRAARLRSDSADSCCARARSDSADSCSTEEALAEDNLTEEALAEEMDKLLGEIDEMRMDTLLFV